MKKLLIGLAVLSSVSAFSSINENLEKPVLRCEEAYMRKIAQMKRKRLIFKPEKGSSLIGSVGQALGATAVGVTAGGVAGFIIPYATSGIVYAGVSIAGGLATMPVTTPLFLTGVAGGVVTEEGSVALAGVVAAGLGAVLDGVVIKGWRVWTPLLNGAKNASNAMIGATMSTFVPISAIIGGATGLTIGGRDAILNAKIRGLYEAMELQETALTYHDSKDSKIKFNEFYKRLPRKVRKSMSASKVADTITQLESESAFCGEDLYSFNMIKRKLKQASDVEDLSEAGLVSESEVEAAVRIVTESKIENEVDKNTIVIFKNLDEV